MSDVEEHNLEGCISEKSDLARALGAVGMKEDSLHLAESGADVALIQEPWIHGGRILGLGASEFRLGTADTGKKRACILAKKNLLATKFATTLPQLYKLLSGLRDESGLNRRNIVDNRIHCCFYFISPFGHGLKPLDVEFIKKLHSKVNIVPVIAKADCLTKKEILRLKCRIMQEIESDGIKIYPVPDCDSDEDEDYKEQVKQLKEAVPFAVCGANTLLEVKGKKVRGRLYPWGVVEVENPDHCDFIKLRTMLITHMEDLQEVTQEVHYENYRSDRLAKGIKSGKGPGENGVKPERESIVPGQASVLSEKDRILQEKEAELRRMQEMLAQMQARMQAQQ
ncbi:hypothetical protein KR067_000790 [Drosophila pandora]|nr:hypothetical protein KR067_000790 [Drosophila pandora]